MLKVHTNQDRANNSKVRNFRAQNIIMPMVLTMHPTYTTLQNVLRSICKGNGGLTVWNVHLGEIQLINQSIFIFMNFFFQNQYGKTIKLVSDLTKIEMGKQCWFFTMKKRAPLDHWNVVHIGKCALSLFECVSLYTWGICSLFFGNTKRNCRSKLFFWGEGGIVGFFFVWRGVRNIFAVLS